MKYNVTFYIGQLTNRKLTIKESYATTKEVVALLSKVKGTSFKTIKFGSKARSDIPIANRMARDILSAVVNLHNAKVTDVKSNQLGVIIVQMEDI